MSGTLTPLAIALGPEWTWLEDGAAQRVVLLHRTGLHLLATQATLDEIDGDLAVVLAGRLRMALTEGVTGEVSATIHKNVHGPGDITYRVSLSRFH